MGLDGGTIATRTDLLRRSSWRLANHDSGSQRSTRGGQLTATGALSSTGIERVDARTAAIDAFSTCSLSGTTLPKAPSPGEVVACSLGQLYKREAVVEWLTGHGQFAEGLSDLTALRELFGHIQRLRDIFSVVLEPNPRCDDPIASTSEQLGSGSAETQGPWICPIDRDCSTDGAHAFVALRPCGHVMRENTVRELTSRRRGGSSGASSCMAPTDGISTIFGGEWSCPVCSAPVEVCVRLHPDQATQALVRNTLLTEHAARKERKHKSGNKRSRATGNAVDE